MSIPYIKRKLTPPTEPDSRDTPTLQRIPPQPVGRRPPADRGFAMTRRAGGDGAPSTRRAGHRGAPLTRRAGVMGGIVALFMGLLVIGPVPVSAQLSTATEGFEDDGVFDTPTADWYTSATSGTLQWQVRAESPHTGNNSLRSVSQSNANYGALVTGDYCSPSGISGGSLSFWVNYQGFAVSGSTTVSHFGLMNGAATEMNTGAATQGIHIDVAATNGVVSLVLRGSGGIAQVASIATLVADTYYDFHIDNIDCAAAKARVFSTTLGNAWNLDAAGSMSSIDTFLVNDNHASGQWTSRRNFDDFTTTYATPPAPGSVFCANPFENNFGYEYVEDVEYDNDLSGPGIGISDGFVYDEDSTGSGYLAKGFNVGGVAMAVNFTIEAAADGSISLFRAAFTTGGGGTPSAANKGDGRTGGNFDNHVGVRIEEAGNLWQIQIRQNVLGGGYNQLGASLQFGNPNSPTAFRFEVDSRDLTAKVYGEGQLLMTRTIDSAFADDGEVWFDQWFVGTGNFALINAQTYLNDNDGDRDSTCIFDLIGGVEVTGSSGTTPTSQTPETPGGDGDGDGDGGTGIGNAPDWVLDTILTIIAFMVIGAILAVYIGSGEGIVFGILGFASIIFSIFVWGMPWYIPLVFLLLPALAVVIWKGPWASR